ncbi:MAG TPA: Ig-like domain-containing protein [Sporichthyaceae bacterium]|nr:Ig-like domain-containing protein [Sporichthyaceae bacterium]
MRGLTRRWRVLAACGVLLAAVIGPASADPAPPNGAPPTAADPVTALLASITNNGGDSSDPGCRGGLILSTDDGSSPAVPLPFAPNFFGARTQLFVNNNGNVTFGSARPDFHFDDLSAATGNPMIAPFLADVDTSDVFHSQAVTYGVSNDHKVFCADWPGVGSYNNHGDKLDKFRMLLIDRSAEPGNAAGDFDIVMDYDFINWDTADARPNSVPAVARVGYSDGTSASNHSFQLPGSGTPGAFLTNGPNSLANHSLVTHDQRVTTLANGRYIFAVRGGQPLPAGRPPVVQDITMHTAEDVPLQVSIPVTDPDGDLVVLRSAGDGAHGTVSCASDPTTPATPVQCTYTPNANFHGTDSFQVNVTDSHGNSGVGTVNVVVDPVNDPPIVVSPQSITVTASTTPVTGNVLTGASDPDGDHVALSAPLTATPSAHGSVSCTAAGLCTYTPNATFTAGTTDSFTFTAVDGNGASAIGTVNIGEHNDPPTASFDARLQTPNTPLVVALDASSSHDPQGPIAGYAWDFGDGSTGTGVNPVHTYAEPGTYTLRLTVTDSGGLTDSVSRAVRLAGPPAPPSDGSKPGGNAGTATNPSGNVPARGNGPGNTFPGEQGGRSHDGSHHDHLELVNDSGSGYAVRGSLREGDFWIERSGGEIRRITGTGRFDDGSSVTFRLRVRDHRAFGTITVRDQRHLVDRFRVDGVRIVDRGDTVEGRARYRDGGGRFFFVIKDRD